MLVELRKKPLTERIDRRALVTARTELLPQRGHVGGTVSILVNQFDSKVYIERRALRNKIRNLIDQYEEVIDNDITLKPLTLDIAHSIVDRILKDEVSFNACFLFGSIKSKKLNWVRSESEHKFTSTGIKFWRHQSQMFEFKKAFDGSPRNTVVSTHISPEGSCNLKCGYCSVSYRDTHSSIDYEKIQKYVRDLKQRGLKAVILTGGGEPTLYKHFNELVQWIKRDQELSVALITNGTTSERLEPKTLSCFSWVRVSMNVFPGWESKISLNTEHLDPSCIVGASMVYTVEHEARDAAHSDRFELFKSVSTIADRINARYIRLLPNCLLEQDQLLLEHENLQKTLSKVGDSRFFQQYKIHGAPSCDTCHQSYFRPYLSEEPWHEDGSQGSVYPCDSVVLNSSVTHFDPKYQLCRPEDVLDYIDGKIKHEFDPRKDCTGCVFTGNIEMLNDWKNNQVDMFNEFQGQLIHEEFV